MAALASMIEAEGKNNKLDPLLLAAVTAVESSFRADAVSADGKIGLLQIDPAKAEYMAKISGVEWQGREKLSDPAYNLRLGAAYLGFLHSIFKGRLSSVLIAQSWGAKELIAAVKKGESAPEAVLLYATRVLKLYKGWKLEQLNAKPATAKKTQPAVQPKKTQVKADQSAAKKVQAAPAPRAAAAAAAVKSAAAPTDSKAQQTLNVSQAPAAPAKIEAAAVNANIQQQAAVPAVSVQANAQPVDAPEAPLQPEEFEDEIQRMVHIVCLSGLPERECGRLGQQIVLYSDRVGEDALLVASLVKELSNFYWFARSSNPIRIGLFQINPEEGEKIAARSRVTWGGASELKNPKYALRLGVAYLRTIGAIFNGDKTKTLTAYLWGLDNYFRAAKTKEKVPADIARKVESIMTRYNKWRQAFPITG